METEAILIQLRKIIRSLQIESKQIEKDFGVSIPQVLALRFLHNQENYQATHTSLKKFLHLNPSTVTGIIQRLEKKALVAGIAHPTDKRITFWTLTAKASILLQKMPPLLHDRLSGKLENLPALERNNILQNLEKIVTLLNIEQIEAAPYFVSNEILA